MTELLCIRSTGDESCSQRCRMGPLLIDSLGLRLYDYVSVKTPSEIFICQAWPRTDLYEGIISVDPYVSLKTEDLELHKTTWTNASLDSKMDIHKMSFTKNQSFNVTVVFNETCHIAKPQTHIKVLDIYLHNILDGLGVGQHCQINCHRNSLGHLYRIHCIILESVDSVKTNHVTVVSSNTDLHISKFISKERFQQKLKNLCDVNISALEKQEQILTDVIQTSMAGYNMNKLGIKPCCGVLLQGPPGVGKTSLVKLVAQKNDAFIVTVNGPEILGSRPGETQANLKKIFNKAAAMTIEGPCIIFFDEIDSLCPKKSRGQEQRIVSHLVTLIDDLPYGVMVIGATNRPNAIDPVLRRPGRLEKEVFIGVPTAEQRLSILYTHLRKIKLDNIKDLQKIADATNGYVGADLASLCREALCIAMKTMKDNLMDSFSVTLQDFKNALANIRPSTQRGTDILVDHRPISWSDIGGLETVKLQIQQAVEWPIRHPDAFKHMGITSPRGVLLYGPPGCCKTTLVRAAATSCGATFLAVSGAQLFSPFLGESERKIAQVFQQARAGAPSILFFDEIDSIIGKRSDKVGSGVTERVLSVLLNQMDGIGIRLVDRAKNNTKTNQEGDIGHNYEEISGHQNKKASCNSEVVDNRDVLVVAATNRPDMLDNALLRPGRMDRKIYVPPPDKQTRSLILEVHMKKMPIDHNLDIEYLSTITENYTGADLENLCREAALQALTRDGLDTKIVKQEHFLYALEFTKPSLTNKQLNYYSSLHNKLN